MGESVLGAVASLRLLLLAYRENSAGPNADFIRSMSRIRGSTVLVFFLKVGGWI